MALSQKGANYKGREGISNPPSSLREFARHVLNAVDDLASQIQATRSQANLGQAGPPAAPHPLTAIAVANAGGFAQVQLTHNSAPSGTQYTIEYSTTPNFQNPIRVQNGDSLSFERYLHGKTLYFRAAPKFAASALSTWTYFGSVNNPTAVTF
jgi:hypothetical protein